MTPAYLQIMWVMSDVCRLFANNVGSFAINSGRSGRIFANNSGRKCGCLQVLRFMFAGRYTYLQVKDLCRLTYAFLVFTDATNLIVFSEKCSIGNSCRLHLGASLSNRLTPTEGFRVD